MATERPKTFPHHRLLIGGGAVAAVVLAGAALFGGLRGRNEPTPNANVQNPIAPISRQIDNANAPKPVEGKSFNRLTMIDLDGQPTTFDQIVAGKPTVVVTFASYDADYIGGGLIPKVTALQTQVENAGGHIVWVDFVGEKPPEIQKNLTNHRVQIPSSAVFIATKFYQENTNIVDSQISGTGRLILVDSNSRFVGDFTNPQGLQAAIAALPKGK